MPRPSHEILCHVDDTPAGRAPAAVGAELSILLGRPLVLSHVAPLQLSVHPAPMGAAVLHHAVPSSTQDDVDDAHARGRGILADVAAQLPVGARHAVRTGGATHGLISLMRELAPGLVVLGADPLATRSGAQRPRWQSIVRAARCPTVLVPPDARTTHGPVLAGYDATGAGRHAVLAAARLAAATGRPLRVAHVLPAGHLLPAPGARATDDLRGLASAAAAAAATHTGVVPQVRCLVATAAAVEDELLRLADDEDAAVVVLGRRRRRTRPSALRTGVASALLLRGGRPIVVCGAAG